MKNRSRIVSRREALQAMSAGISIPLILSKTRRGFAAESTSATRSGSGYKTNFVDDYAPGPDARVELVNGKIVDVLNGAYYEPGTRLLMQGGRIAEICAPDKPFSGLPEFTIDLGGKSVLPGLFNTHCHIEMVFPTMLFLWSEMFATWRHHDRQRAKNMEECLAHGITNIRDTGIVDLGVSKSLKDKISKGEIRGPRILQSIVVGPPGAYMSGALDPDLMTRVIQHLLAITHVDQDKPDSGVVLFPICAGEQKVRDAVDRAVDERGAECIKVGEQSIDSESYEPLAKTNQSQLAAIADQAQKRGLKTTIHQVEVETFRRAVECGISSFAHMAIDDLLTEEDVQSFKEAGCFIEPTATVAYDECWIVEGDPLADHPDMKKLAQFRAETIKGIVDEYWIPELGKYVAEGYERITSGNLETPFVDIAAMVKYYSPIMTNGAANLRLLYDKGANIACGNDGGVTPGTPAMMQHEMGMFDFTLNNDPENIKFRGADAVKISTINSARAIGLDKDFGSLEAGKVADLAIVDGDPLEDVSVIGSRVAALFMDGKLVINNCGLGAEKNSG